MKHLIIVASGRGGVGKSTVSRFIGEWALAEKPSETVLVDGDGSVGQLVQFLGKRDECGTVLDPQPADGVQIFQLHDDRARAQFIEGLTFGKELVLVDLPAASLSVLEKIDAEFGLGSLVKQFGYQITLVTPITPYQSSILNVAESLSFGNGDVHRVVVRNLGFGNPDDFELFNGSQIEQMAKDAGAVVVDLPALRPAIMAQIDRLSLSFAGAADLQKSPLLLTYRGAVAQWLAVARQSFDAARRALGL